MYWRVAALGRGRSILLKKDSYHPELFSHPLGFSWSPPNLIRWESTRMSVKTNLQDTRKTPLWPSPGLPYTEVAWLSHRLTWLCLYLLMCNLENLVIWNLRAAHSSTRAFPLFLLRRRDFNHPSLLSPWGLKGAPGFLADRKHHHWTSHSATSSLCGP